MNGHYLPVVIVSSSGRRRIGEVGCFPLNASPWCQPFRVLRQVTFQDWAAAYTEQTGSAPAGPPLIVATAPGAVFYEVSTD